MKIPLAIHEGTIDRHRKRGADGDYEPNRSLEELRSAMVMTRTAAEKIVGMAHAVSKDRTITAEAGALKLRQAVKKVAESTTARLDRARAQAAGDLEHVNRQTSAPPPPRDALELQLESELRQRLLVMKGDERSKLIGAAMKGEDEAVAGALLRGHPALVGITQAHQAQYREQWRRARFPAEADRIARLGKAIGALDIAGKQFLGLIEAVQNNPVAALAEEHHKQAEAALAEAVA